MSFKGTEAYAHFDHLFYSQIGQNAFYRQHLSTSLEYDFPYKNMVDHSKNNISYNFSKKNLYLFSNRSSSHTRSDYTDTDLAPFNHTDSDSTSIDFNTQSINDSVISFKNVRNVSYLKSTENISIDQLLVKMKPIEPPKPEPAPVEVVKQKIDWFKRIKSLLVLLKPINANGNIYLAWLALVSLAYIYNIFSITVRLTFDFNTSSDEEIDFSNEKAVENSSNETISNATLIEEKFDFFAHYSKNRNFYWFLLDYSADLIYLIDIFFVKTRLKFLSEGLWVSDLKLTALNYFKSSKFFVDVFTVFPFDLIQLVTGITPLTRLNRVLKLRSLLEFFDRWDRAVQSFIFVVRLIRLFVYLQIVIHLYSCVYYKLSSWETKVRQVNNDWVYEIKHTKINRFVFAYLFGLKTASTIGNNPQPYTREEYLFTAISSVVALFLFALIVGQIRNIIGSLSTKQDAFLIVVDTTTKYFKSLDLPKNVIDKIGLWFEFYSKEQNAIPFSAIEFLPINVQTDVAISVYLDLISKVKLFQECEKNLLYALVLKLKPIIFMPGDYICRKGEVGREMYIVDWGVVEVIVNDKAVAQMKVGSCFGEISLLSMGDGGNRRTANVVSKGFSKLLVLHKTDFNATLTDYPDMRQLLRKTAE